MRCRMSIGSRLARERRNRNLTQEQLAEKLGVTRQAVSRWESDTAYPETDKIVRMATLFGVSCDYLLGVAEREGEAPPSPVTRLLQEAVGKRLLLSFYEEEDTVGCRWCQILDFDGGWANVEFVKDKKGEKRDRRLIPLSSIRTITILPEGGKD